MGYNFQERVRERMTQSVFLRVFGGRSKASDMFHGQLRVPSAMPTRSIPAPREHTEIQAPSPP